MSSPTCRYFVMCNRPAVGVVANPILGDVPTCQRCAEQVGAELVTDRARCEAVGISGPDSAGTGNPGGVEWARELGRFLVRYRWSNRAIAEAIMFYCEPGFYGEAGIELVGFELVGFDGVGGELASTNVGDAIGVVALRGQGGDVARFLLGPSGARLFDVREVTP